MDCSKEDNVGVNVKSLRSIFLGKEDNSASSKDKGKRLKTPSSTTSDGCVSVRSDHSIEPPLLFKEQLKTPKSSTSDGCLSVRSDQSIEPPLLFKGKQLKTPSSTTSDGCVSMRSDQSIEPPLLFKGKQLKTPSSTTSDGCVSVRSDQSIEPPLLFKKQLKTPKSSTSDGCLSVRSDQSIEPPLLFKGKQLKTPSSTTSDGCVSMRSDQSIEPPLLFKEKQKVPYGMPQPWGGQIIGIDPCRLKVQCPPFAAYPVARADHRAPDDLIHSRMKLQHTKHSGYASDTSESSVDTIYNFEQDEQEEEVICDICHQETAVKTCLTCNSSYCESHARQHYRVKALRRHIFKDTCDEVVKKLCRHYKKSLCFFCTTDLMQICSVCTQGNHRGHDIIPLRAHPAASQMSGGEEDKAPGLPDTVVPPPGKIKVLTVEPTSVVLSWGSPQGLVGSKSFRVEWSGGLEKVNGCLVIENVHTVEIDNLQFGQQYLFSVATADKDGNLSEKVTATVFTAVPAPRHLTKEHSEPRTVSIKWTKGDNMEEIPHQFLITVTSPGIEPRAIHTKNCNKIFSDLQPDTEYKISVSTVLNDRCSESVYTTIHTEPCLRDVLSKIGLQDQYDNKLTLSTVLEINQNDTSDNQPDTKSLPEICLKRLMMLNANARSVTCESREVDTDKSNAINPLDLTTALFLCSDGFLQQDIVLNMALCQFAVPLLLPNHDTREITMMLWSMRGIVRTFRPSEQASIKSSCEERIVLSDFPLVSFVRLGDTILSKSEMLNKLLSSTQQFHDTFCHRKMVCGDVPRRISNGLVEFSWYLPCGDRDIDKFTEPLAVANLRGDIRIFDKQFSFLCQTSASVYIFCDESEADYFKNLEGKDVKANVILISSLRGKTFTLKMMTMEPGLKITDLTQKKKTDTELIKALQESICKMLENCPNKVSVANMADRARCCGIMVDEDSDECQSAWKNVDKITKHIANTSEFKDKELTSQGYIWKGISWLETECWRLRKAGSQNTEDYRKSLKKKEKELRRKQLRFGMTEAMSSFLNGVVTSEVQCYYFLKCLEIDLDNLSRKQLSELQDQYKDLRQKCPQNTERIAEIDKQISVCSLRLEHFFRECGQLYECAQNLSGYSSQRKTMEQLPALCAQMLLDGFPFELVDGDAANIPMKWITKVFNELFYIMQSDSKLKVITIIGAENSGKSTLLNTMFGIRFAVSKGTCTRGAFIQLINVNKDVRKELGCDCIMIIDTEGLKPHQMVQDDHSHERDGEVASLAVALSDAVIISLSEDNANEKDILKMVLRAFTRFKDVGKKPRCHFVHTAMSNRPAEREEEERKKRGKKLVRNFNEMIRKDATMKKANVTKISDVMEFDPDTCSWYIPPVWHGTPPMAPFSVDYSETALALKKRLIGDLKKCRERGDLRDFISRVEHFWKGL